MDIVGAAAFLLGSASLWPIIAALVKLESEGPVLVQQFRGGVGEKPFRVFKFRTMRNGHDPSARAHRRITRKQANNHRVTRVGRILRTLSLDELPQLINVLRGDMSLIGPRPLVFADLHNPYRIARSRAALPPERLAQWRRVRSQVRPGLTGLWQVSGRSTLPLESWISCDVGYVRESSPWLDACILLKTFWAVLSCKGAR